MDRTIASSPENSKPGNEHPDLFGPPPLFEGEEKSYNPLLIEVSRVVIPADVFEKTWIRDYAYHTIEVLRLRRVKVDLIRVNEIKA
jgi:hypothetical protein